MAFGLINGAVICTVLVVWTAYIVLPEPERREIDFRSPLLGWNRWCQTRVGA
jgi:hypothetical protein